MRVRADRETCIGAGMCALTAPEVFDQDPDDGRVVVDGAEPEPALASRVRAAVRLCPSGALALDP